MQAFDLRDLDRDWIVESKSINNYILNNLEFFSKLLKKNRMSHIMQSV